LVYPSINKIAEPDYSKSISDDSEKMFFYIKITMKKWLVIAVVDHKVTCGFQDTFFCFLLSAASLAILSRNLQIIGHHTQQKKLKRSQRRKAA
jgi:hypothetical protein